MIRLCKTEGGKFTRSHFFEHPLKRAAPWPSLILEERREPLLSLASIRARILARMNAEAEKWLQKHRDHIGRIVQIEFTEHRVDVQHRIPLVLRRYLCKECAEEFSFRISA